MVNKQIDMFWRRCYSGNGETQLSGAFVSDMVMVWNSRYLCCFFNTVGLVENNMANDGCQSFESEKIN